MLAALMTAYYMFRLLFVTFFGTFRGTEHQREHLHESPALMTIPIVVIAVLSVAGGFIGVPEVLGGHHALNQLLQTVLVPVEHLEHLSHNTEFVLMGIAVLIGIIGIVIAWIGFKKYNAADESKGLATFFENKWYIDELYASVITNPLNKLSVFFEKFIEKSGIDALVNGVGKMIQVGSQKFRLLQSGLVGFYMFLMVIGIIVLFVIQVWVNKL
jgi:NADH-quinone oxidoreductase subunit L